MSSLIPKGVPYAQIAWAAIEDTNLTPSAFRVYSYLMRRANSEARAWPGHRKIAKAVGINKSTVGPAVAQLEREGWIEIHVEDIDDPVTGHEQRHSYTVHGTQIGRLFDPNRTDSPDGQETGRSSGDDETVRIGQPDGLPDRSANPDGTVRIEATDRTDEPYITRTNELEPELQPEEVASPQLAKTRQRDLLWEAFVAVHGDPATESERGKFNTAVKKLREAEVTPDEYPMLVQAYTSKNHGNQPAPMTVPERVGEMRHYARRGPVVTIEPDELQRRREFARLEAEENRDALEGNTQ